MGEAGCLRQSEIRIQGTPVRSSEEGAGGVHNEVPFNIQGVSGLLLSYTIFPRSSVTSYGRIVSAFWRARGDESAQHPSPGAYTVTWSATSLRGESSIARLTAPTTIMQ